MTDLALDYRGELRGLAAVGSTLVFTTEHTEGQSTAIFQVDLAKKKLDQTALDCGVTAQLLVDGQIWLAGTDGTLRTGKLGSKPKTVGEPFDERVVALAARGADVAVVAGSSLHIVTAKGGRTTFDLGEPGRAVATDPTGQWIAVGTTRGHMCVLHDGDGELAEVSRTRLHDGEVTGLAFAPDELRVYSTGSDCRLLISFVRGALDTEDRGGSNMHEREARAVLMGPDFVTADGTKQRFYTAGMDSTIKAWPRGRAGSQRPTSQGDGVVQTSALAVVELDGKPHLAAAGLDTTIRVFAFDDEGRVGERVATIRDAYADAEDQLHSAKPKERQAALEALAGYADAVSLQQLAQHVRSNEQDHKLQVRGVELLGGAEHRTTARLLEEFFGHGVADVRVAAFKGLRKVRGDDDLDVLRKAFTSGHEDLGLHAIEAGARLGTDAATELIRDNLDHGAFVVRYGALRALEALHGDSPQGTLLGLKAGQADVRRVALSRVLERGLLGDTSVQAQLRRMWDDSDDRVRLWAFAVSTHRRPNLVKALRAVDDDYHRHVFELEELPKDEKKRRNEVPKAAAFDAKKLDEDDFRPLLEAMGSRSIDVSLRGARGLAALGDERSFGTLLQLSREPDASSRVAVCKALAVLGDPRAVKRIRAMLHDGDSQVRDAAFTALDRLQPEMPLATVRAGFATTFLDVRERALALLVKTARAEAGPSSSDTRELLAMALNDGVQTLRQEAFKSTLNLAPKDHVSATLRFILQSIHADIRSEVLQEAKAKPKDADFRAIVLAIIDDADERNRAEAFAHALDKWPSTEHPTVFRTALGSRHVSQRIAAVRKLSEEKGEIRSLLVEALADAETDVRLEAVRALVQAENRKLLADALRSEHLDVRVEAASALAVLGDERSLAPLIEVVDGWNALLASKPNDHDVAAYRPRLKSALTGLSHLGDARSIDAVLTLLDGESAVAHAAAATLPAIAHPSNLDKVRAVAERDDAQVKLLASLALTYNGDATHAHAVFGKTDAYFELFAALGLRDDSPERLLSFVDASDARVRNVALALVLALELTEHAAEGVPERSLALLAAENAFIRLSAAEALEHYGDQPAFYRWVYAMLNGLSSPADAWSAEPRKLLALSRAVTLGEPRVAVRAGQILAQLTEAKGDEFKRQYALFEARFGDVLAELEKQANQPKPAGVTDRLAKAWQRVKAKAKAIAVAPTSFEEALRALAFGAYVGLVRQQQDGNSWSARLAAIAGLLRLAPTNERFRSDAIAVVLMTLGDPNQAVRERAFDALGELGASADVLSTEALSTGFPDMGLRGLELLASDKKGGNALLERTLLESTNGLEDQAAKLLTERVGQIEVYRIGLGAASPNFRASSVRGLAREAAGSDAATKALRSALDSGHDDVRHLAARELAKRKDGAAYDVLIDMLADDDSSLQSHAVSALQQLRDERAPGALLDRVEDDPDNTSAAQTLLDAAVSFQDPSIAPRLIALIDADRHRYDAFTAAHALTGYEQYAWVDDEEVTPKWEETLDPRHPELFAELFDLAYRIADVDWLGKMVGLAKWPAANDELDRTLAALTTFSHEHVRHRAVEISGWRLRHRDGPSDSLTQALQARDPLDQFFAAEGLALAGQADGLAVLRTTVEAMDDWSLRERAVLAIGRLADPSTVDMLLALANDESHPMQRPAAEAIGHMSSSDRADEVFDTLKRLASSGGYDMQQSALKGLRWFGTPGAWDILRREAKSDSWWIAQLCVQLLRFDEASRDVIADVLRENDDWDVANACAESLRHVWGPDSLEPDYLLMEAGVGGLDEHDEAFDRLRKDGDVARILDVLPKVHEDNRDDFVPRLVAILLSREPLPVAEAAKMLESDEAETAAVAAQIVGRAGPEAGKAQGKALVAATKKTRERWQAVWSDFLANRRGAREKLVVVGTAYRRLVWACGQLHVGNDELLAAAALPDHEMALPIREDAVATLGEPWFGKDGVAALVKLARGGDARLRSMAAAELDRCAPGESAKLLASSVHDDVSFGRLLNSLGAKDARQPLRDAIDEAGGIALPRLAALGDIEGLLAAMRNAKLEEATRRGAIDALATIASPDVAQKLAEFGADDDQDELLRKAAWRARRRVTRAVAAQEAR